MENVDLFMGIIVPYVNFFLFFGMAVYFFRKPLRKLMEKRREVFVIQLHETRDALAKAHERETELKVELDRLDQTIANLEQRMREDAEREAEEMIKKAENLARHLKEEAKRIAEAQIKRARETIKSDVMLEVKAAVIEKLREDLDDKAQLDLVHKKARALEQYKLEV